MRVFRLHLREGWGGMVVGGGGSWCNERAASQQQKSEWVASVCKHFNSFTWIMESETFLFHLQLQKNLFRTCSVPPPTINCISKHRAKRCETTSHEKVFLKARNRFSVFRSIIKSVTKIMLPAYGAESTVRTLRRAFCKAASHISTFYLCCFIPYNKQNNTPQGMR